MFLSMYVYGTPYIFVYVSLYMHTYICMYVYVYACCLFFELYVKGKRKCEKENRKAKLQ